MVDAHDSKSCIARCGGSSPLSGTVDKVTFFVYNIARSSQPFHSHYGKAMGSKFAGGIYLLTVLPIWATAAILFAVTAVAMAVGRDLFEGVPYQVAYSAMIGDAGLIMCVLIAATILQRGSAITPGWMQNSTIHALILSGSVILGALVSVLTIRSRSGHAMDVYHDVVIGPIFLYLAIILLPIIFKNGSRFEAGATIGFILLWLALVAFDTKYQRMDQRRWLQTHHLSYRR
jgi:hypothetical protein